MFSALACAIVAPASAQLIQRKDLSYAMAKTIAENALADCKTRGYAVSVVVVDRGGDTMVALRADNAGPHTMENARRKAYTARTFRMTTEEFVKAMATNPVRREQTTLPSVSPFPAVCRSRSETMWSEASVSPARPAWTSPASWRGSTRSRISCAERARLARVTAGWRAFYSV